MKTINLFIKVMMISAIATNAMAAAPAIDSFHIQSFLKLSNNAPVSATSADFVFAVFKGSNCIWAKRYSSVAINSGVMNQKISGNGTNIASIVNASATPGECVANFSGTALDSTLLNTGATASLSIRVYAETTIDTYKPIWDIPLNSAPTAFIADLANTATTATTANDLAASVKITTSAGASDNGKFPVLSGSGQISNTMINNAALTIANTQVTGLGTAATVNTGTTVGTIPVLGASGRLGAAQMPTYVANRMLATDGSGVITSGYDTATSGGAGDANKLPLLNGSGQLANAMIDSASLTPNPANLSATVPVNKGGTGATTFTSGNILTGNGTGAITSISTVPVANGGTGAATLNSGEVLLGNGTGAITSVAAVPVTKGGTGLATLTANALVVGAGTSNVTAIAPSTSGNVLYSNGTNWLSGTKATAGIVDTSSAQAAIAGAKKFTTSLAVGSSGTAYTQIITCTIASAAMAAGTKTQACTGVTTSAIVQCSPQTAPPAASAGNAWVLIPYPTAGNVNINVTTVGTPGAWTSAFTCIAIQ